MKMIMLAIFTAIFLILFVACGNNESVLYVPNNYEPNDYTSEDRSNILRIAVFEGGYGRDFWDDAIQRFEAANPGVTVNMEIGMDIERIAPQIVRGEVPDFLSVEMVGIFAVMLANREFLPLDDFFNYTEALDSPGSLLRDIILPGVLESPSLKPYGDGVLYFAPFHAGATGLIFNQNLFDEMGWSIPSTWDEFFAMDALLDSPDTFVNINGEYRRRYMFTYQGIHPGYMSTVLWATIASEGGTEAIRRIENFEEGAWDNPQVRSVLDMLVRLGTGGYMLTGTEELDHIQSQQYMMMGKALFIPCGAWIVNEMESHPREDGFVFGMAPVPSVRAGNTRYAVGFSGRHAIPAAAANTELALEFLRFLYTRESVAAFARLGHGTKAVVNAAEIGGAYLDPNIANMAAIFDYGEFVEHNWSPIPDGLGIIPNDHAFAHTMTPLMLGNLSIDDYISRLEEMSEQIRMAR